MRSLYLDTARLGQTSPSALQAQIDFARLTAREPTSLYFDRFLADGIHAAPSSWAEEFPGLSCWGGVTELKESIKRVVGAPSEYRVLLANRSAMLMRFAARQLFRLCGNVLTTDMSWPAYQATLFDAAARVDATVTELPLRKLVFEHAIPVDEIASRIARSYADNNCDGLFLPAVDHMGARLPIRQIVQAIKSKQEIRFVVIDGAQAVGHVPEIDCFEVCDFFIGGVHKWIRAYNPMGFAIYGRRRTQGVIRRAVSKGLTKHDPLSRFTSEIENRCTSRYSETVSIVPMFSARGAIDDQPLSDESKRQCFEQRIRNADQLTRLADQTGWQVLRPDRLAQSGALILQRRKRRPRHGDQLRQRFQECGIVLSAYKDERIRVSSPQRPLTPGEIAAISRAIVCI